MCLKSVRLPGHTVSNAMAVSMHTAERRVTSARIRMVAALIIALFIFATSAAASAAAKAAPGRKLSYEIHVNNKPGTH